ncbi:RrF2 family transcriptional regulator [Maliponia aquimaris]|uniref:HTH-type transcriptional repressor NsrR n=1 Tax=Maliponia aquimaris TaxID=1673631 RepID=A0A238L4S4_9RHOB|nr:Rrf2 family transcriptional regulator [Maliponia aquimaris]SMX49326.1 HTH-type transcriptional repressor NsrR [Maliponia aquimaris]
MRLTKFTDYALRLLLLAASKQGRNVTIEEAAALYGISAPHLKKVVRTLCDAGFLAAQRGPQGGFRLNAPPDEINLGQVIRVTEPDFSLVECYRQDNACVITQSCALPRVFDQALAAMLGIFDSYCLADLVVDDATFRALMPDSNSA